jgi:hypothetical protein
MAAMTNKCFFTIHCFTIRLAVSKTLAEAGGKTEKHSISDPSGFAVHKGAGSGSPF